GAGLDLTDRTRVSAPPLPPATAPGASIAWASRARSVAQHLGKRVGERPWLKQLHDVSIGHGVSLLCWRSGGVNTPTIRRLHPVRPSPTFAHSSPVISRCHRRFAEHDPAAIAWGGECRQRSLCPNPDLPAASRAAELLYAVCVHGRTGAAVPQIAAARAERVRSLDRDIAGVEREGIAALDAVPLEGLQEDLRHRCIAVVRIEYIDVVGPKPG